MGRPRERRGHARAPRHAAHGEARGAGEDDGYLRQLTELGRDPARWQSLDADALLLIAFQQCLYFGATQDADAAATLGGLYPHLIERVPVEHRVGLLDRVTEAIEEDSASVLALLPFVQHETAPSVVATATVSFASLMPLEREDPMTGPRTVVRMLEHADDEGTRLGLLAGLLQLGDRRTRDLLLEGWRHLPPDGREQLAALRFSTGFVFASVAEFWIDCLEDADATTFGAIARALGRLAIEADPPRVLDLERKFPANAPDERDEIAIVNDWTLAEYADRITPRLRDLARRENAPHVLPETMAQWGIESGSGA